MDQRGLKTLKIVCQDEKIPLITGSRWICQRKELGTPIACRRTGKIRSGRSKKVTAEKLNEMLNVKNPVRDQPWDIQIDYFQLFYVRRTMQRACKAHTPKAGQ